MEEHFRDQFKPRFAAREAIIQRIGWVVLALLIVATILGFLGGGPVSDRTVTAHKDQHVVSLTYDRWGRMHSPLEVRVEVNAPHETAGQMTLTIDFEFAANIDVIGITPESDSTSLSPAGATYTWRVDDWQEPLTITVDYISNKWLTLSGDFTVAVDNRSLAQFEVSQFLFP